MRGQLLVLLGMLGAVVLLPGIWVALHRGWRWWRHAVAPPEREEPAHLDVILDLIERRGPMMTAAVQVRHRTARRPTSQHGPRPPRVVEVSQVPPALTPRPPRSMGQTLWSAE